MEETRFSNSFKQHIFRRRTNTKRVNSRDDEKHKWTGKNGKSEVIKLRASFPRRGGSISYRCIGIYIALQPCNFGLDVGKTRMRRRGNRVKEGESLCHELETLRQHPSTSRTFDTQLSLSFSSSFLSFALFPFPSVQERLILIHDCSRRATHPATPFHQPDLAPIPMQQP